MYESISYAELKKLPAEQKPDAWKELKSLYKTQKELAEKLGVGPALVYNMISRYVKDEPEEKEILKVVPDPKKTRSRLKKQDKQEQNKQEQQEKEPKLQLLQKPQEQQELQLQLLQKPQEQQELQLQMEENIVIEPATIVPEVKEESFTIAIKKTVSGEEAQFFLNGVGGTLLKNQKYMIEVKITEE